MNGQAQKKSSELRLQKKNNNLSLKFYTSDANSQGQWPVYAMVWERPSEFKAALIYMSRLIMRHMTMYYVKGDAHSDKPKHNYYFRAFQLLGTVTQSSHQSSVSILSSCSQLKKL